MPSNVCTAVHICTWSVRRLSRTLAFQTWPFSPSCYFLTLFRRKILCHCPRCLLLQTCSFIWFSLYLSRLQCVWEEKCFGHTDTFCPTMMKNAPCTNKQVSVMFPRSAICSFPYVSWILCALFPLQQVFVPAWVSWLRSLHEDWTSLPTPSQWHCMPCFGDCSWLEFSPTLSTSLWCHSALVWWWSCTHTSGSVVPLLPGWPPSWIFFFANFC